MKDEVWRNENPEGVQGLRFDEYGRQMLWLWNKQCWAHCLPHRPNVFECIVSYEDTWMEPTYYTESLENG